MSDKLQWISDMTIPDWMRVTPGQNLGSKTWQVRNAGTTTWSAGYMLTHDSGDRMGAPASVALPALPPNGVGLVTIPNIVAPTDLGYQRSNWLPRNAEGQSFTSNLTIVVDVAEASGPPITTVGVTAAAQELSGYGITLVPDNWTDAEAQRVCNLIVQTAQRLHAFALIQVPMLTATPQDVFRRFFPRRVLRRNPAAEKLFACTDPANPTPATCARAYAWNDGTSITFYSNAIFNNSRPIRLQSPHARFEVTFTTEFLVLHELSHSHPWVDEYEDSSQPLIAMVEAAVGTRYDVETATIASAGFKQGARSVNRNYEFSTDAIANWCQESYTGPADGDGEGFGNFRRNQMDTMVRNWVLANYGPIHH